jgi:hypothetical protein
MAVSAVRRLAFFTMELFGTMQPCARHRRRLRLGEPTDRRDARWFGSRLPTGTSALQKIARGPILRTSDPLSLTNPWAPPEPPRSCRRRRPLFNHPGPLLPPVFHVTKSSQKISFQGWHVDCFYKRTYPPRGAPHHENGQKNASREKTRTFSDTPACRQRLLFLPRAPAPHPRIFPVEIPAAPSLIR